ncbi:hypothetical protein F511_36076 [Dorcoceras hygrometricum]|uniref:Uncharacterized protein n=1 Tax=Dorcoceras hygrometricum TaxID=472368 RepID=A0A2Z7CB53_9LAMI|nr:hypothetical protein F511_36076 [Dorcoceras hygrometricum]
MLYANWDTLSTSWGPPAGSKPRPAEKPVKHENTYRQQHTSPRATSVSNPSTESSNKQHKENIDKYANAMQGNRINMARKKAVGVQKEGSTRRFDGYRPSANTQSPSLAPGSTMNETMKYKSIEAVNLLVSNTENSITQGNQKINSKVFSVKSGLTVLRV